MIKRLVKKIFSMLGYEVTLKPKKKQEHVRRNHNIDLSTIRKDQLNPKLHLKLAKQYFENKRFFTAWAEYKTAVFFGLKEENHLPEREKFQVALPVLTQLNHNPYFRLYSIANAIKEKAVELSGKPKVLDVGGGDGTLAAFIPEFSYCLVDPAINGVNGLELPFEDESFEFVVSCHVLEHIPPEERTDFLLQLTAKAKNAVILLNPIHIDKTLPKERLEMLIDTTNAIWAKEHLDCSLPTVESVEEFAKVNELKFTFIPNGTLTTSIAMYVVDFLSKSWDSKKYKMFNEFYNTQYTELLDSDKVPNAGLFILEKNNSNL